MPVEAGFEQENGASAGPVYVGSPFVGYWGVMKAVVVAEGGSLEYTGFGDPIPGPGEVVVELRAASVNRRDLLVANPPGPHYAFPKPFIPGSDGAGIRRDTGEEVVIYPGLNWGELDDAAGEGWEVLGGPSNGTYAELVKVPAGNLFPRPQRFSWAESAAFPLAALTAYRALFTVGALQRKHRVLILGAGSGVSTLAVQLAVQAGARVFVTSSSNEKIERSRNLGAEGGVLYTDDAWPGEAKAMAGAAFDLVLDSVGTTWNESARALRRGGRLVVFGGTGGPRAQVDVRQLYLSWLSILGTTMGSPTDFEAMLDMAQRGSWVPVVDQVFALPAAAAAHERMREGRHFGKLVLKIS
jgi:NADPH:quinone reductase-like Zn-dependent oxidoreductase